jgi:hypothetical protein
VIDFTIYNFYTKGRTQVNPTALESPTPPLVQGPLGLVVKRITSITQVCNDKIASSILAEGISFCLRVDCAADVLIFLVDFWPWLRLFQTLVGKIARDLAKRNMCRDLIRSPTGLHHILHDTLMLLTRRLRDASRLSLFLSLTTSSSQCPSRLHCLSLSFAG